MLPQVISILSSACLLPEFSSASDLSALYKKYIPPVIARSCNTAVKMALTVASQVVENHSIDYAVFCSEHGELNCGVSLLTDLSRGELLSPSDFSHSVHNTASGIFSIVHKLQQNMTSIASGKNTFLTGVVSALTWLKLHPDNQALLTIFDDHIPTEYQSLNLSSDQQYAVAFLLSTQVIRKKMFSVNIVDCLDNSESENKIAGALLFYDWLNGAGVEFLTQGDCCKRIAWKRNHI
ncbi:MAG: hypothetical protein ACD_29C00295G0001 [uncultured bacterium]|nr:MAG: hypothetical protein ACD_29C00295G0001 [uncultured bacterium]OGT25932.1 MAG: hypothetical protein A3B71_07780 [Gammaproteobacteria bacterium RIFCSPHIGHO2_02_FULL_42_43]OGT52316.1 MAG: hypothetical protein A3E54_01655 [Gammaproteobacteria bacterium RIFCSPHIGHO2_12_FULL_41_25]OGT61928.1 MAG: hypothetical protein A3I77_01595 [Gammaproteobacteria bacterium RIFCSPLOWO2_02_FULL_42_14]OGT86361.1 MAG: hypothetical protein A3G86_07500 [Gammaproteobacteria bacterium RIFCSPLOWO2_12_FULL_42_18]